MSDDEGKNWFSEIKESAVKEGFPHPAKVMGGTSDSLPDKESAELSKQYDYFEAWYTRARMKAVEFYIISKTTGTKSKDYCYYKFFDTLAGSYESRVKKISREYSRREHEYKSNKI